MSNNVTILDQGHSIVTIQTPDLITVRYASIVLGESADTAYRGDRGKIAYDFATGSFDLLAIEALSGTGFLERTGTDTWVLADLQAALIASIDTASGGPGSQGAVALRYNNTTMIWSALDGSVTLRGIYYPGSFFGNALDTSKSALLIGQTVSFANVVGYIHGITGIQVNIHGIGVLPGLTGAQILTSFSFATWNGIGAQIWTAYAGTAPTCTITYVPGQSTEVRIVFPNVSIVNKFLKVTVAADLQTNLASADVFIFGSCVCATGVGSTPTRFRVNASDTDGVRSNNTATALVTNIYDLNKDGVVDDPSLGAVGTDLNLVRTNQQIFGIVGAGWVAA